MRILVLGGTLLARQLVFRLAQSGHQVTTSVAGRTNALPDVPGKVRVGGFGGVAGLVDYLHKEKIDLLVDATHPFAAQMNQHSYSGAEQLGIPRIRLTRQSWRSRPEAKNWFWTADHYLAAEKAKSLPGVILLTVGRQNCDKYFNILHSRQVCCRLTNDSGIDFPENWQVLLTKGPFNFDYELNLFNREKIAVLISKDSGGKETSAKLDVAKKLGVQVIMISRPKVSVSEESYFAVSDVLAKIRKFESQ